MTSPSDPRADGRVVVAEVGDPARAHDAAERGVPVVVVGTEADAAAVGTLVGALVASGARAVAFVSDAAKGQAERDDALAELVGELFPVVPGGTPEPA